jgi:hypothetical protein
LLHQYPGGRLSALGFFHVGVLVVFVCLVCCGGSLMLLSDASSGAVLGLSIIFCLHVFTNSPWMHSAAGLLCSTVFVTFVLWLWMGVTGCRGVGFGSLSCSLGLGGLGGGWTPLGSDLNRQFFLAALSSRMSCMNSLNSDIFTGLILFALTWLSALTQLSKQRPQIFQRWHILQFPSQWTLSKTHMLAKSFAHVLPCLSLNLWHGEELFTLSFILFSPGPPSLLASSCQGSWHRLLGLSRVHLCSLGQQRTRGASAQRFQNGFVL